MSPLQTALGADWSRLPPALQAHHGTGDFVEQGHLDITFPRAMQPWLWLLGAAGVLLGRRGLQVETRVDRHMDGERQHWRRTVRYPDRHTVTFDSLRVSSTPGRFIEYVNPWLGLEMAPAWDGRELTCRGVRFVLRLGRRQLGLPQWFGPGVTHIAERALDDTRIAMDFHMTHPWFGRLYRYTGQFGFDAVADVRPSPASPWRQT